MWCLIFHPDQSIIIEEYPLSILIPVNETAVFSCKASCLSRGCTSHWVFNTVQYDTPEQLPIGFSISINNAMDNGTKYFSSLSINTSVAMVPNGSNIFCVFELMGHMHDGSFKQSSPVKLLLISGECHITEF